MVRCPGGCGHFQTLDETHRATYQTSSFLEGSASKTISTTFSLPGTIRMWSGAPGDVATSGPQVKPIVRHIKLNHFLEKSASKTISTTISLSVGTSSASQAGGAGFDSRYVQYYFGLENSLIWQKT